MDHRFDELKDHDLDRVSGGLRYAIPEFPCVLPSPYPTKWPVGCPKPLPYVPVCP